MAYNKSLEEKLIKKLQFKRKYLEDKSGYWLEKSIVSKSGLKFKFYVESDKKLFLADVLTYGYYSNKLHRKYYETVLKKNCDFKTISNTINKFK